VLLELVGEFFEVRTQVDRDLTTVSRVDRQLGLIKNLGRHRDGVGAFAGKEEMTEMKLSDSDESQGGTPADGVGAPGAVEDVKLRQEKTP
jgi:hypothetical protein